MAQLKLNNKTPVSLTERIGFLIYRLSHFPRTQSLLTTTSKTSDTPAEPQAEKTGRLRLFNKLTDRIFSALELIYPFASEYPAKVAIMKMWAEAIAKLKDMLDKLFTPILKLTESIYLSLFHNFRLKQWGVWLKAIEAIGKKGLILVVIITGYILAQGVINLPPRHIVVFVLLPIGIAIVCMKPIFGIITYIFLTVTGIQYTTWGMPTGFMGVRMFLSTPVLLATMISWALDMVKRKEKFKAIYDSNNTLMILFWGALTLSTCLFTVSDYLKGKGIMYYDSMFYADVLYDFLAFANWFVVFFIIIYLIGNTKNKFFYMLYGIASIYGYITYKVIRGVSYFGFGTDQTVTAGFIGQMSDNNELAVCLNMAVPIMYALFLCERSKPRKAIFLIFFIMAAVAVIYTRSRGGLIGLGVISVLSFFKLMLPHAKNKFLPIAFAGILGVSGLMFFHDKISARIESIGNWKEDQSATNRITSIIAGWEMMKDSPIIGQGSFSVTEVTPFCPDNMIIKTWFGEDDILVLERPGHNFVIHNAYAAMGGQYGAPCLVLFVGLIFHSIKKLRRLRKQFPLNRENDWIHSLSHAFELSIIVYAINAMFLNNPQQGFIYIIYAMTSSLCYITLKPAQKHNPSISFLGLVLFGLWLYFTVVRVA